MKRLVLMIIPALICGMVFTSCDKRTGETPSSVAEKICKAYTTKDWASYFEYLDITQEEKERVLDECLKASTDEFDLNPCIKYEILGEQISGNGQKAQVTTKFTFRDGTVITNKDMCFTKTDDGWRMLRFTAEGCRI